MIAKLFFVALFSVAFATKQVGDFLHRNALVQEKFTDEETLRRLTEEAGEKARQVSTRVDSVKTELRSMTKDRFDSLMWQTIELKTELQKVIKDTVFKGMEKNKGAEVYECIAKNGQKAFERIESIGNKIPEDTENLLQENVVRVMSFKYVVKEFNEYIEAFYQTKSQELKKANSDAIKKKIMKEVMDKMSHVQSILENINKDITDTKYKFFEDYIHYAFEVSNTLRKAQTEETDKIKKCIA